MNKLNLIGFLIKIQRKQKYEIFKNYLNSVISCLRDFSKNEVIKEIKLGKEYIVKDKDEWCKYSKEYYDFVLYVDDFILKNYK